jgi:hypothetical protein
MPNNIHLTQNRFFEIASIILDPLKSYYSPFPEFSPLEFEHFCCFLLGNSGYEIVISNDNIEADGGIDFVAKKNNQIIIGQCKKSDWSGKIVGGTASNISRASVMQHFGVVTMQAENYFDNEVIGYFLTLRIYSKPTRETFGNHKKMKLIDLPLLRQMISEVLTKLDAKNFQLVLRQKADTDIWQDQELARIKEEIQILEALIADQEVELEQYKNKSSQAQKIITLELIDLYREIDLLRSNIEFIKLANIQKAKSAETIDEELTKAYQDNQQKINEEYEELEEEFTNSQINVLDQDELAEVKETKKLYYKLCHLYHEDKNSQILSEDQKSFQKILSIITNSKSDFKKLVDIRDNPHKYFQGKIPESVNISKQKLVEYILTLQTQLESLQNQVEELQDSEQAKIFDLYFSDREAFDIIVENRRNQLKEELLDLEQELEDLKSLQDSEEIE